MEPTTDNSYLKEIENFILNNKIKNEETIKNFLRKLIQKGLKNAVKDKIKSKKIYFIRHAQAFHNTFSGWLFNLLLSPANDPDLTIKGLNQCKKLNMELNEKTNINIDTVFISPLKRAIHTFLLISGSEIFKSSKKYILSDLIREKLKNHNQVGSPLSELKENLKEHELFNFDYLVKEKWWSYEDDEINEKEKLNRKNKYSKEVNNNLEQRLILFLYWIVLSEENSILIVSHSYVFKWLTMFRQKAKNAKIYEIPNDYIIQKLDED
jgi:broad specificity phosphatase PhoE